MFFVVIWCERRERGKIKENQMEMSLERSTMPFLCIIVLFLREQLVCWFVRDFLLLFGSEFLLLLPFSRFTFKNKHSPRADFLPSFFLSLPLFPSFPPFTAFLSYDHLISSKQHG